MRKIVLSLIIVLSASLSAQELVEASISHDGMQRDYLLYVPENVLDNPPLVINFHGYTSSAVAQYLYSDFTALADEHGFLVAHPQGTNDSFGQAHWNIGQGASTVDDVGFTSALIDSIDAEYALDLDRVYSTGMSNGGFFSYHLACNLSERIAAVASVTGSMIIGSQASCETVHPTPAMQIHGTADSTVPLDGTFGMIAISEVVDFWVNQTGSSTTPSITAIEDIDPDDGATATHYVYANGENGSSVEYYLVENGGHTWPGASVNIGTTCQDFDATIEIWRFFSQYDINGAISTGLWDEAANTSLTIAPNPSSGHVIITSDAMLDYELSNLSGEIVSTGRLQIGANRIDLSQLSSGIYILSSAGAMRQKLVIQ